MRVLVTGAAGFIGSFVSAALLDRGDEVTGLDNLNDYYDPALKAARLERLTARSGFGFVRADLADATAMAQLFDTRRFDRVVHLGAQAGVRYSVENPRSYVDSNVTGTLNVLEGCRRHDVQHLVFASTSSVYGASTQMPFSEHQAAVHPVSIYAATKRAGELMAHSHAAMFGLPVTALRFFTVYGPWGRPDMALFKFTRSILAGEPIELYNHGRHRRDFTYVDDVVEGVVRVLDTVPVAAEWNADAPDPALGRGPFRVYNIGNSRPVELVHYIDVLERCLGRKAERRLMPMQRGDVADTWADVGALAADLGYAPGVAVEDGVARFVDWYRDYYRV